MGIGPTELLILLVVFLFFLGIVLMAAGRAAARRPTPVPPPVAVPAALQTHLRALIGENKKILAIKQLREATGLSLLDAKNAVDALASGGTLPTAAPAAAPTPRADLADRARSLAARGREGEAVRGVATETRMSAPEAAAFVRALLP